MFQVQVGGREKKRKGHKPRIFACPASATPLKQGEWNIVWPLLSKAGLKNMFTQNQAPSSVQLPGKYK